MARHVPELDGEARICSLSDDVRPGFDCRAIQGFLAGGDDDMSPLADGSLSHRKADAPRSAEDRNSLVTQHDLSFRRGVPLSD